MGRPARKIRGIFERPKDSGVWWIRYSANGREHREKVGARGAAIDAYRKRRAEIREGKFYPASVRNRYRPLLKELVHDFLAYSETNKRKRSYEGDLCHLDFWTLKLGDRIAETITPADIEECKAELLKGNGPGKERSPATVNRYRDALLWTFNYAGKNKKLSVNPVRDVKRLHEESEEQRTLTVEEELRTLDYLQGEERAFFITAIHTGIRAGGLQGVAWGDVDFTTGTIRVRKSKTKTYTAYMNSRVRETLTALRAGRTTELQAVERGNVTALPFAVLQAHPVFPRFQGERSNLVTNWWREIVKTLDLDPITFHAATRHTCISRMVEIGIDLLTVARQMGHSTVRMVEQRYAHLSAGHRQDAVERLVTGGSFPVPTGTGTGTKTDVLPAISEKAT